MRFTVALATLLAGTASAAAANANANACASASAGAQANVDAKADVAADVAAKAAAAAAAKVKADVDAKVSAQLANSKAAAATAKADVPAPTAAAPVAAPSADAATQAALKAVAGFQCPAGMSYCPWAKSCSCPAGQNLDINTKKCVGTAITGAWPEPKPDVFASKGVEFVALCAATPYKIVPYNKEHEFCQAGLNSITFVASSSVAGEIAAYPHSEIDVLANVSADLKATVAGLAGLYVATAVEAAALFNTDVFGLATAKADVDVKVVSNLLGSANSLLCVLGVGKCKAEVDCVSYCTKGCKNFIDVGAAVDVQIGAQIQAINGLAVLPSVLLLVSVKAQAIVTVAVDHLLCMVGGLVKAVLSTFNCNCH